MAAEVGKIEQSVQTSTLKARFFVQHLVTAVDDHPSKTHNGHNGRVALCSL